MKIAIIGAGNMGGAIARGLAKGSLVRVEDIRVSNPSPGKLEALKAEFPDMQVTADNSEAVAGADIVVLAVKPWMVGEVLHKLQLKETQMLISIAAGIKLGELWQMLGQKGNPLFRVIPNTAISEMQSMTLVSCSQASQEQIQLVLDIFSEMGLAMLIPEEKMAAATAMTSCGIAYALKYIQTAMQAGIEMGLSPANSMRMTAQTLHGAADLLLANNTHPALEIEKVTTPGGITIKGLNELEHAGFTSAVIRALKASR